MGKCRITHGGGGTPDYYFPKYGLCYGLEVGSYSNVTAVKDHIQGVSY